MTKAQIELVKIAIPLWYANVAWAKELLVRAFQLFNAHEILGPKYRGRESQVPNTCWFVLPHGVGVSLFKAPHVGGIDFDFDKPNPDSWRLTLFIKRQVNDGQLPYALYRELVQDKNLMKLAVEEALRDV